MTSALNSAAELLDSAHIIDALNKQALNSDTFSDAKNTAGNRSLYRDVTEKQPGISNRDYLILGALVIFLHLAGIETYIHLDKNPSFQRPKKTEVIIEFVKPEIIPPPKIEPPKPLPPPPSPPKVRQPVLQKPTAALRTPPAAQNITADDMTVKENTEAPISTSPVISEAPSPPAPPAPVTKEEPITEATGYAGYLKNPAPDYPAVAQRQGWEGKVVLRVRVLADGTASSVEVKQSSKRKVLDDAAIAAVKGWMFSPSKRGNTPIDGWATVPIEFKIAQ